MIMYFRHFKGREKALNTSAEAVDTNAEASDMSVS